MKFKCRKRKEPNKHSEGKRMTLTAGPEKRKYWRANWIFICGAQKVKMRKGAAPPSAHSPHMVRSFIFFIFGFVQRSTLGWPRTHTQFYFMGVVGTAFLLLCSTDFRVGMWNMLIPSDYNCCIPGPSLAFQCHCPASLRQSTAGRNGEKHNTDR